MFWVDAVSEVTLKKADITGSTNREKIRACVAMAVDYNEKDIKKKVKKAKQFVAFFMKQVTINIFLIIKVKRRCRTESFIYRRTSRLIRNGRNSSSPLVASSSLPISAMEWIAVSFRMRC